MRTQLRFVFFVAAFLFGFALHAQTPKRDSTPNTNDEIEQRIENLTENGAGEESDYTNLVEALNYYSKHPLNLNTASREQLEELLLLDELQITALLDHISKNGKLINLYELQTIRGFDLTTITKILPYVTVNDYTMSSHFSFREMMQNGVNEVVLREQRVLETQKGYTPIDPAALAENPNARYLGDPNRLFFRYRFTYSNNVSWGVTADKDPGEQFFKGAQKNGFDFYSAHLAVRNVRFVKTLVLGDFQAAFGQGLTCWTGFAFGKTADAANIKRNAPGLRPYVSADENLFLRGAGATVKFGHVEATAFASRKKIDANVSRSDTVGLDMEVLEVSSLQNTGLHTTPSEIADKDAITEMLFGGNVSWRSRHFNFGVTGLHSEFSVPLHRNLDLYNQFDFSAQRNDNIGADYNLLFRNVNIFGETSVSGNGGIATINGMLVSLDPRLSFSLLHRYFQKDFQNLYANAFADGSSPANEQGIYMGMVARPGRRIMLTAYYDRFVFPWLRYRTDAPSDGQDWLAQINFIPDKKSDMYFRFRHRERFTNAGDAAADEDYVVPLTQDNYRINVQYPVSPSVRLRHRVEYTQYEQSNKGPERGIIIYQDISYKKLGSKVSFTARYALFQTDSYNARIYTYENDMLYAYSIPSLYYRGSRAYLLMNWDITRRIEMWFRIAQTIYNNQHVISEGSLNEIDGNTKTEVKIQLRVKF